MLTASGKCPYCSTLPAEKWHDDYECYIKEEKVKEEKLRRKKD
jgi:hypothetical protein